MSMPLNDLWIVILIPSLGLFCFVGVPVLAHLAKRLEQEDEKFWNYRAWHAVWTLVVAISLGLVFFSVIMSTVTTPIILIPGLITLAFWVLISAILGLLARTLWKKERGYI